MAIPTSRQIEYLDDEISVIIHLDLEVFKPEAYNNMVPGDIRKELPASLFNPPKLDTDQWISTAAAAGARAVVFVAKHCTGFSMWPTKLHDYSVASAPWKDGQGDLVAEVKKSCEKYGLKFGIYNSAATNHMYKVRNGGVKNGSKQENDAYNTMYLGQLRELCENYGKLNELWFDGDVVPAEDGGPDVASVIEELQPDAIIFGDAGRHVNGVRFGGAENGCARLPAWGCCDSRRQLAGNPDGKEYCPVEAVIANRVSMLGGYLGGWFWHAGQDHTVHPAADLVSSYYNSVGRNGALLIGMCIDDRGLVPDADKAVFEDFGRVIRRINSIPRDTTQGNGPELLLDITKNQLVSELILKENIVNGEHVRKWHADALAGGEWTRAAEGEGIGHKRIITFDAVRAEKLRLVIDETAGAAEITEFSAYYRRPVCPAPNVYRTRDGYIHIDPIKDAKIRYTLDGSAPDNTSALYTEPVYAPAGGIIRAVSVPDAGDDPLFPELKVRNETTLSFGDMDADFKVVSFDGQYDEFNPPENMLSSECPNPWISGAGEYPKQVTVDMTQMREVKGFIFTPAWPPGYVHQYAFYIGDTPETCDRLAAKGAFSDVGNMPVQQTVEFEAPVTGRYYRFVALEPWTYNAQYASIKRLEIF